MDLKFFKNTNNLIFKKTETNYKILFLFLIVFFAMSFNIINYNHELGYDAAAHKWYVEVLPFALPTDQDTYEFFSPPLPYIFPSLIDSVCDKLYELSLVNIDCTTLYGKSTQILQALMFVLIIYFYMNIAQLIMPFNREFLDSLILLLVIISANYKTFAMIRGEPYVAFFISWSLYLFAKLFKNNFIFGRSDIYYFGIIFGLLALSRQWGFLYILSLLIFLFSMKYFYNDDIFKKLFKLLFWSLLIAFIISSWFYFGLFIQYGSFTTFNEIPQELDIKNNPISFYTTTGFEDLLLFKEPFRGSSMTKGIIPILHSDTWGDWWGYFLLRTGREGESVNISETLPYLGRVNAVALIPTTLYLLGLLYCFKFLKSGKHKFEKNKELKVFYFLITIFTVTGFAGFLWFNIKYPEEKGDTVKAAYIIYLLNILPFYGALFLNRIKNLNLKFYKILYSIVFLIFIHNIPTMITNF